MDESVLGLLAIFGFFAFIALMVFLEFKISDFIHNRKEAKRRKEHPEFFRLYDDYDGKGTIACRFYNKEVAPLKRQVEVILREEPYWPQEVREKKLEELEEIRRKIYICERASDELFRETEEARQKVAEYVHAHNIKWAGDWD